MMDNREFKKQKYVEGEVENDDEDQEWYMPSHFQINWVVGENPGTLLLIVILKPK